MTMFEKAISQPDSDMMEAVKIISESGVKTGILTNNWRKESGASFPFKFSDLFNEVKYIIGP